MNENEKQILSYIEKELPKDFCPKININYNSRVLEKWIKIMHQGYKQYHNVKRTISISIYKEVNDQELDYMPKELYHVLKNTEFQRFSFQFTLKTPVLRKFNIFLYVPLGNHLSKTTIHKLFEKVYVWFFFVSRYSNTECSKTMNLHIYKMDQNKEFPRQKEPLGPIHVNSAFTTSCLPETSIYIYRNEEWGKVMIHESFHNFGLDFSSLDEHYGKSTMLSMFPHVETDSIRIFECYCETWATFFNSLLYSFLHTQNKTNYDLVLKKTQIIMQRECVFSLMQCASILKHYGFTYTSFLDPRNRGNKMVEHTNVLSYYILKCILLCHFDEFFTWCKKNNEHTICFRQNYKTIEEFIQFISKHHRKPEFHRKMRHIENSQNIPLNNTLRMTLYG